MIRIGLIGFGYWGPNLARNLMATPGVALAAIADNRAERRAVAASRYPQVRIVGDAEELIGDPGLDAVVVATSVSTHFELSMAAVKAGKHVLVEKPLAASAVEAAALVEAAEHDQRVLMVDHTYAYTGAVAKMTEIIARGDLGEVCYYDSIRINLGLFQNDVSVIWDLAVHDLSILQALLRKPFRTVQASGGCHLGSRLENVAHLTLELEGGMQAHVNVSWIAPVKIRQTIVVGDRQMLVYDDLEPDEKIKIYDRGVSFDAQPASLLPEYRIGDMYAPRVDRREALANVCAHFAECIAHGGRPRTGGLEGLEIVRVLEAAQESLRSGGRQVTL